MLVINYEVGKPTLSLKSLSFEDDVLCSATVLLYGFLPDMTVESDEKYEI